MRYSFLHFAIAPIFLALLTGCSSGLDGTYSAEAAGSTVEYEFKQDGTVYVSGSTILGDTGTTELKYEIDGDKLKIIAPNGENQIFTIKDDGSINAGSFTLQKNASRNTKESENTEEDQVSSHSTPGQYLFGKWKVDTIDNKKIPNGEWFMIFSEDSMISHVITDEGEQKQEVNVRSYSEKGSNIVLADEDGTETSVTKIDDDRIRYGDSNNMLVLDRVK